MISRTLIFIAISSISLEMVCSRSLHEHFKMAKKAHKMAQDDAEDEIFGFRPDYKKIKEGQEQQFAVRALKAMNTIGSINGRAIIARQEGNYHVDEYGVVHSLLPFTGEVHEVRGMTSQREWSPYNEQLHSSGFSV